MTANADESKGGRPTKYKPEYCAQLIEHMAEGLSFESFAGLVGVCRQTIYTWTEEHPEFLDAKKKALELNLLFWEKTGVDGLYSTTEYDETSGKPLKAKTLNSAVYIFNMKNRHKWRDKQPDENDVVINNNNNTQALSDADLEAKIDAKLKALKGNE